MKCDDRCGSFAPHAVYVLQLRTSGAPRKRQLATEERRVVKGHYRKSLVLIGLAPLEPFLHVLVSGFVRIEKKCVSPR